MNPFRPLIISKSMLAGIARASAGITLFNDLASLFEEENTTPTFILLGLGIAYLVGLQAILTSVAESQEQQHIREKAHLPPKKWYGLMGIKSILFFIARMTAMYTLVKTSYVLVSNPVLGLTLFSWLTGLVFGFLALATTIIEAYLSKGNRQDKTQNESHAQELNLLGHSIFYHSTSSFALDLKPINELNSSRIAISSNQDEEKLKVIERKLEQLSLEKESILAKLNSAKIDLKCSPTEKEGSPFSSATSVLNELLSRDFNISGNTPKQHLIHSQNGETQPKKNDNLHQIGQYCSI